MKLTKEIIEDIMVTALEGGINYWCDRALPEEGYPLKDDEYLSGYFARTGRLILWDNEEESHLLTLGKFQNGFTIEQARGGIIRDPGDIDAEIADRIIQYAIFGELVYG